MSLSKKIDFAVIFKVKNANPNGDPLNGNRPRITLDSYGEMSDVCNKRKIRNRLIDGGKRIFVQSDDNKIDECKNLRERAATVLDGKGTKEEMIKKVCEEWFDVRAFGQVFAFSDKKGKEKDGLDSLSLGIRGPVSIHPAFSVDPVEVVSSQITKSVNGEVAKNKKNKDEEDEEENNRKSSDTMGMKHRVGEGIYSFVGSMNPQLAHKTGFSDEDADAIKSVLPKLFENDASSARPEGSMRVLKVIWWEHNCKSGQYSSAKVHNSLKVNSDGTYGFDNLDGLDPEEIDGF